MKPKPFDKPVYVSRPFLPPLAEFASALEEIWANAWLTNNGPVVQRLHGILCERLGTKNVCLFTNGTLGLQIALQGMQLSGEVITTPFTFVATSHALICNGIRPVFVDIEAETYTLDPKKVEAAITPLTTAILGVHVYGFPCQHDALAEIARRRNLSLLYDAAHAFNVRVAGCPIERWGDLSMVSFHSTKLFHSIEGGMVVVGDVSLKKTFDYLKNFGFENEEEVVMAGTNAKMSEFQALMGLQVLKHLPSIVERRRLIFNAYRRCLTNIQGIIIPPLTPAEVEYNYAYFPIEINEPEFGMSRDEVYERLKSFNIFARRYFYPLLCDFACYRHLPVHEPLTVARRVASQILTLPMYDGLTIEKVERICEIIRHLFHSSK